MKKKTKTRNEKRVEGQYISSSPLLFLLYTNYKIVVSDYCQPHHTKRRPSMHSAREKRLSFFFNDRSRLSVTLVREI